MKLNDFNFDIENNILILKEYKGNDKLIKINLEYNNFIHTKVYFVSNIYEYFKTLDVLKYFLFSLTLIPMTSYILL